MTTIRPDKHGTLVLQGYALKMRVTAGHLELEGGIGTDRVFARLNRATSKLRRLIVMPYGKEEFGFISPSALYWLKNVNVQLQIYSRDGELMFESTAQAHAEDVKLRRAQVLAANTETGLDVARTLLGRKIFGQADNLTNRPDAQSAVEGIRACAESLGQHYSQETIRIAEARAADLYWRALADTPVQFDKKAKVPDHWRRLGLRHSPLTNSARNAICPANAMLNYLYSLVEGETTAALHVAGLDPQLGFNHQDRSYRASLTSDVMETVRPLVDRWLLELLAKRTFSGKDFGETREGVCRLSPQLAAELAATLPHWRAAIAPMVALVADLLRHTADRPIAPVVAHREHDAKRLTVKAEAPRKLPPSMPIPAAKMPASRRCALCANVAATPIQAGELWYCSAECQQADETRTAYLAILEDRSTWTPETWEAIYPAIRRVPQPRLRAVTGYSPAWTSTVVGGTRRPPARLWAALCAA